MNKLAIAFAAIAVMAAPAAANAAGCRDAKGHFAKCPPAAAHAPAPAATHAAMAAAHPVAHATAPARKAPCRDAKTGRFKKC
jgi:hypothetical protein